MYMYTGKGTYTVKVDRVETLLVFLRQPCYYC